MKISRRTFLKGTAATTGSLVAARFLYGRLDTLWAQEVSKTMQEDWVPTTCWIGKQDCGILARRLGGRVVKLEGDPNHPLNRGTLCPKGQAQIFAMYDPNRVKTPLIRTNEKGVTGEWKPISWDEALNLVAEKIKESREKAKRIDKDKENNPYLVWQKGRSKAKALYDTAFVKASGATKLHHGAYCSDAGYRASEYTIGLHGVLHPDFKHTKYLLSWGWNITNAGGNKFCWITWPQQFFEARERGLKVIHIDPRLRGAGPFADKWVPIKPGTDLALALTFCHELIRTGNLDLDYLKRYTNAPFLVGEDGYFLRDSKGKELFWDSNSNTPQAKQGKRTIPALEGEFVVDGKNAKTVFELFKKHVARYTPEWASEVCDIPVDTIREIARELAEQAMIGSTIEVEGQRLPYRPVAIMAYHVAQQELGFQAVRGMLMVCMLLGSVGAVGGQMTDFTWKVHKNYKGLDQISITDHPNVYLDKSKFYPINSNLTGIVAKVMQNPEKYGVEYLPEVAILHMVNPVVSFPSQEDIKKLFEKLKFVAVIDPWLSETADLFGDVILPAATLEKYEGPMSATDQYVDAVAMRIPVMEPLYDSKSEIEIYIALCEKAGILYGAGGYLDQVNKGLKIKDPHKIPLNRKVTPREIYDRWARSEGIPEGIAYFEKHGVYQKGLLPAKKRYGYAIEPIFGGAIHRLYGESLLRLQEEMKKRGVDAIYWQDYTPFPTWRELIMDTSPGEYDLYLISYKMVEYKQARSTFIPLLAELAPKEQAYINPKTAVRKGIQDGERVWAESHNAVTGETRKVRVRIRYSEGLRPDTMAMPHHYGMWTHPWSKGQGSSPNKLFFTGEGYVTNTADQTFHVKVKVYKAEQDGERRS